MHYRGLTRRALLLVGLGALGAGGCGPHRLWPADRVSCFDDPYGLMITPPDGAAIVDERCRSGFNPDYRLSFTMAPSDLEFFQAAAPVTTWGADTSRLLVFDGEAERATSALTGYYGNGAITVEALIGINDPERYTVYYSATVVD